VGWLVDRAACRGEERHCVNHRKRGMLQERKEGRQRLWGFLKRQKGERNNVSGAQRGKPLSGRGLANDLTCLFRIGEGAGQTLHLIEGSKSAYHQWSRWLTRGEIAGLEEYKRMVGEQREPSKADKRADIEREGHKERKKEGLARLRGGVVNSD